MITTTGRLAFSVEEETVVMVSDRVCEEFLKVERCPI
jgi:hypothetical protein